MLSIAEKQLFKNLREQLGITFPSAQKYVRENKYPLDIAIKADILSKGELTVAKMCPDTLGKALPVDKELATVCLNTFDGNMSFEFEMLFVSILNYFEVRQPALYKDIVDRIQSEAGGKEFITKRIAHRGNK